MSSSAKIVPTLNLGGRFWRLQKEAGKVVGGSFGSTTTSSFSQQATTTLNNSGRSQSESGSLKKVAAWGSKSSF